MDLIPADDRVADAYGASPKELSYGVRDGQGCFDGSVHLPQGAKITSVTTYYSSAKTNFHTRIRFYRKNLAEEGGDYLITREIIDNTGTKTSVQDIIQQSVGVIRNNVYIYSYGICLSTAPNGAAGNFFGALINYQYSSAGD